MSEIHIGSRRKLRRVIATFNMKGVTHNLSKNMTIPRHNGLNVIYNEETKEAVV